ncbi:hypothetical protein DENSPDRAFT_886569 [Dentipellis sp. KUC8613]|nr:hypothetical protein DENSPDRAFT_886569 [Dentipellis sp. KUC8613]
MYCLHTLCIPPARPLSRTLAPSTARSPRLPTARPRRVAPTRACVPSLVPPPPPSHVCTPPLHSPATPLRRRLAPARVCHAPSHTLTILARPHTAPPQPHHAPASPSRASVLRPATTFSRPIPPSRAPSRRLASHPAISHPILLSARPVLPSHPAPPSLRRTVHCQCPAACSSHPISPSTCPNGALHRLHAPSRRLHAPCRLHNALHTINTPPSLLCVPWGRLVPIPPYSCPSALVLCPYMLFSRPVVPSSLSATPSSCPIGRFRSRALAPAPPLHRHFEPAHGRYRTRRALDGPHLLLHCPSTAVSHAPCHPLNPLTPATRARDGLAPLRPFAAAMRPFTPLPRTLMLPSRATTALFRGLSPLPHVPATPLHSLVWLPSRTLAPMSCAPTSPSHAPMALSRAPWPHAFFARHPIPLRATVMRQRRRYVARGPAPPTQPPCCRRATQKRHFGP